MTNTQNKEIRLLQKQEDLFVAIRDRLEQSAQSGEPSPIKKVFERLKNKHEKIKRKSC